MSSLLELQRAFRTALLTDAGSPDEIRGGIPDTAARLDIYRNNVVGNLTGALRLTFPAVQRLVGEAFFAAASARFAADAPPAGADLYEYGAAFPGFLAAFAPAQGLAYLPDVARLEWAVHHALHAAHMPALTADAITAIPAEHHADLRFTAHPSLSLLALSHPAHAIWQAVLTEDAEDRAARLADIDPAAREDNLAVVHTPQGLQVFHLSPAALRIAEAFVTGHTLGVVLDRTIPEDASSVLGLLLANGCFSGCQAAPQIPGEPNA